MFCPRCGTANPDGSVYCTECGTKLEARCSACGADNPPASRFCRKCGEAIAEIPARPVARTPAAYTPRHLTEKILTSRSAMEGERKRVTVLFADVRGSVELARSVDAEVWHGLEDVVRHYEIKLGFVFSDQERADLVAFLKAL